MPQHFISFFVLALLIGSCAPAPTPPPTATATQTVTPTPTTSATPTSMPQTNEHLIVTRDLEHWAVLNADGSLQKYIQTPDLTSPSDISPDGKWVTYESGTTGSEPYDYSLYLFNLKDGSSQFVARLLAPGFPENIEPIVKSTLQYDLSFNTRECADMDCRRNIIENEVTYSAGLSDWSPDGQMLAFAAQIDGPSLDIYIYSMQDKTIRRLTDDLQNIGRVLAWSPDGKRLLYTNTIPGTYIDFDRETFHVIDLEGKELQLSHEILTSAYHSYIQGWIDDNLYVIQTKYLGDTPQSHPLVVLNMENGEITEIWPHTTEAVDTGVVDTDNKRVILSFHQPSEPIPNAPGSGTYFISVSGESKKISSQVFDPIISSSQIIGIEKEAAYHILSDGSVERIDATGSGWLASSSPDKKWFLLDQAYDDLHGHSSLSLYNNTYQKTRTWVLDGKLIDTTWRSDSLGIFLFTSDNIYYLDIPGGEPQLLDMEVPPCTWDPVACAWIFFSAWLP